MAGYAPRFPMHLADQWVPMSEVTIAFGIAPLIIAVVVITASLTLLVWNFRPHRRGRLDGIEFEITSDPCAIDGHSAAHYMSQRGARFDSSSVQTVRRTPTRTHGELPVLVLIRATTRRRTQAGHWIHPA